MDILLLIIGLLVVLGLILLFFQYNQLSACKKKIEEAWNRIDVQLNRRYEIIPGLINVVQDYTKKETTIFKKIMTSQRQAAAADNILNQAAAENNLSQSIKTLFALSEDHPNLKQQEAFRNLQQRLSQIEDDIYLTRQNYNEIVKENNRRVRGFPGRLIAAPLGFGKFDFFEIKL